MDVPDEALDRPVSHEDRERAVELLRVAGADLGLAEVERRLDAAVRARTVGELAALVWDLDRARTTSARHRRRSIWQDGWFRVHAAAYGLTNGFLVGTWALTGHGFFWPFFPAAGWGIGLGVHAVAAHIGGDAHADTSSNQAVPAADRGRPLPPPSRSHVVVMFVDVVDSTRLTELIGDEEWSRIRARHRALLHGCYETHRGTEVSAQGDGFLARFTFPADAVRCAVEIQRRLRAQREGSGFAPAVRIGIHAGEAMEETGDLLGTVINMAARVMSEADAGEVLVTEAVADHLDGRFELDDRGLRTLKGLTRPRHLLAVCWVD